MAYLPSFITLLAQRAHETTIAVASLLEVAEEHLPNGRAHNPNNQIPTAEKLRDLAKHRFPVVGGAVWPPEDITQNYSSLRLARLVIGAWMEHAQSVTQRPDVLGIVCQFLANPNEPQSYDIVRFAVVLALRARYEIRHDEEVLRQLREQYEHLREWRHRTPRSRIPKGASKYDYFLIDLLCLDGRMRRGFGMGSLLVYYLSFREAPFGVLDAKPLTISRDENAPFLVGDLPEFGELINLAFTQPTAVPGLDAVTGGLLGPVRAVESIEGELESSARAASHLPGGLITLIGGPPGSGKTSLAIMIARRMSELGSVVRYVSTEEEVTALKAKAFTMARPLAEIFDGLISERRAVAKPDLDWVVGDYRSLEEVVDALRQDFEGHPTVPPSETFFLTFSRAVILDSITALMEIVDHDSKSGEASPQARRRELARMLAELRRMGLCVILIGSAEDARDAGLAYVVDNVFSLTLDPTASPRHPVRLFAVDKTRLQRSSRGSHVFHVGGPTGCSISPSLHSVLKDLKHRPIQRSDPTKVAVLWVPNENEREQGVLSGIVSDPTKALTLRGRSQVVLYGPGPSGKARLALSMAIEPFIASTNATELNDYFDLRLDPTPSSREAERLELRNSRILVISFLYDMEYYQNHLRQLIALRFGSKLPHDQIARSIADVLHFHPGFVDPETVVGRVRQRLRGGELEGRPYSAVIIDGVHNVIMQFPLLEIDPLLWSTLARYFRTLGVMTITTFTFFEVEGWTPTPNHLPLGVGPASEPSQSETISGRTYPGQELFFRLLVGTSDYTFQMKKAGLRDRTGVDLIRIREQSSPESFIHMDLLWNPEVASFMRLV